MKCPLRFRLQDLWSERERIYSGDCLKEECAWWNSGWNMCWVASIGDDLQRLANLVDDIKDKMPFKNIL